MLLDEGACRVLNTDIKEHTMKLELIALRALFVFGSIGMFLCMAAMFFGLQ